jgi:hypothetical protein
VEVKERVGEQEISSSPRRQRPPRQGRVEGRGRCEQARRGRRAEGREAGDGSRPGLGGEGKEVRCAQGDRRGKQEVISTASSRPGQLEACEYKARGGECARVCWREPRPKRAYAWEGSSKAGEEARKQLRVRVCQVERNIPKGGTPQQAGRCPQDEPGSRPGNQRFWGGKSKGGAQRRGTGHADEAVRRGGPSSVRAARREERRRCCAASAKSVAV